jgi:GNAT superfamily N-acetyltransferase
MGIVSDFGGSGRAEAWYAIIARKPMIRRATPADVAAIAALSGELGYATTAEEMQPRVEAMLASDKDVVLVAVEDDRVVGWMHACLALTIESGLRAEIRGLVVTESLRGGGIGAQLVAAAEQWAGARGMPRIRVRCNALRERTHRFYERLGYSTKKVQKVFEKELP